MDQVIVTVWLIFGCLAWIFSGAMIASIGAVLRPQMPPVHILALAEAVIATGWAFLAMSSMVDGYYVQGLVIGFGSGLYAWRAWMHWRQGPPRRRRRRRAPVRSPRFTFNI